MHTEFHGSVTAKKGAKNRSQRPKSGSHSPDVVCNQHLVSAPPGEQRTLLRSLAGENISVSTAHAVGYFLWPLRG